MDCMSQKTLDLQQGLSLCCTASIRGNIRKYSGLFALFRQHTAQTALKGLRVECGVSHQEFLFGTVSVFNGWQGWADLMKCRSGIRQSRAHPTALLMVFVLLISDILSLWPRLPWQTQTYFPPLMPSFHVQLKAHQAMVYFLPCFCCAAIIAEPCLTSAVQT